MPRLLHIVRLTGMQTAVLLLVANHALGEGELPSASRPLQYGQEIYQYKARCIACHGWAGDGEGAPHSAGDAANLRLIKLSREQLIQVISCGVPGSAMPHFDAFAYSEDPCYGLNQQQVGKNMPPDPPKPLQLREIEVLIDYLEARIIGRGEPNRADCEKFYGESPMCERYAYAQPAPK